VWKDYFDFNKRQRNGIIVLLVLIMGMMIYLLISDYLPPSPANVDFSSFKADMAKIKTRANDTVKKEAMPVSTDTLTHPTIELNSADTTDLMALPGITPKLALTIVHFRDALGGYYRKEQLKEVYGMSEDCYNAIAGRVIVDSGKVEKIDINRATEKDMTRHPYIHKKLAKAIYDYRKENGSFSKLSDLLKVEGIDEEKYNKLVHYLVIGR
jgi:competence ComEA-like helix-hairpin-helix protein